MPYISQEGRTWLSRGNSPKTPGELNYAITQLCKEYMLCFEENYQTYNDILGALEGAKLELYRRKIGFYEDTKIKENGDVY